MKTLLVLLSLAFAASLSAQPIKLSADAKGVTIDGDLNGRVTLAAPTITGSDKKARKAVFAAGADGLSATATYPDGFVIRVTIAPAEGTVAYGFDQPPVDATAIVVNVSLPLAYADGGTYSANGAAAQPFPAESGKQLFAQGAFKQLDLITGAGTGLSFTLPASYQQLQDNRIWGTPSFSWIYHYDLLRYPATTGFVIKVSAVKK